MNHPVDPVNPVEKIDWAEQTDFSFRPEWPSRRI